MNRPITECQTCKNHLEPVFFAGWIPPVNTFHRIGSIPREETCYPLQLLRCPKCTLVQLGYAVDPTILFPKDYGYTSGTTKALRDNFTDLAAETQKLFLCDHHGLVVDIGSNDGTCLNEFAKLGYRVQGVEPTDARLLAEARHIPTLPSFFNKKAASDVVSWRGKAAVVTASNVFAHVPDPHEFIENAKSLLIPMGVIILENHYLRDLLATVQFDTIYHEHLRFYDLTSLQYLLKMHGLEVVRVKRTDIHGGSIRTYVAEAGKYPVDASVGDLLKEEEVPYLWRDFSGRMIASKFCLMEYVANLMLADKIYGIGAPSRAVTLTHYMGLDHNVLDCVCEVPSSRKIGNYLPGTRIPIVDEKTLYTDQPSNALLLSWHIADDLIPRIREKGFKGKFIVPLPELRVV